MAAAWPRGARSERALVPCEKRSDSITRGAFNTSLSHPSSFNPFSNEVSMQSLLESVYQEHERVKQEMTRLEQTLAVGELSKATADGRLSQSLTETKRALEEAKQAKIAGALALDIAHAELETARLKLKQLEDESTKSILSVARDTETALATATAHFQDLLNDVLCATCKSRPRSWLVECGHGFCVRCLKSHLSHLKRQHLRDDHLNTWAPGDIRNKSLEILDLYKGHSLSEIGSEVASALMAALVWLCTEEVPYCCAACASILTRSPIRSLSLEAVATRLENIRGPGVVDLEQEQDDLDPQQWDAFFPQDALYRAIARRDATVGSTGDVNAEDM